MKYLSPILIFLKKFIIYLFPYLLFLVLVTYKLLLFDELSGEETDKQSLFQFTSLVLNWIQTGDEGILNELRNGITMVSIGAAILCSFWILLLPRKSRLISLISLHTILSTLIFANLIYYRYFEDIISTTVLLQLGQIGALGESIANLFTIYDWLFFIDIIVLLPTIILIVKTHPKVKSTRIDISTRIMSTLLVFSVGYILISSPIKVFIDKGGAYLFEKTISNMRVYNVTGLLGFHGYDIYKYTKETIFNRKQVTEEEIETIGNWYGAQQQELLKDSEYTGVGKGKNVIVLQVEALENFIVDLKINEQEITPNLNRLKKKSLYFNRFYHQTASGRTSDAEFLFNTSLYPLSAGSAYISYSNNRYTALPGILKNEGYSTNVLHAYKKSFWNRYLMYPSLGYDTFYSLENYKMDEPLGWSIADKSMLEQSFNKMLTFEQPFLSTLITLTSHHPYDIPDNYKKLNLEGIYDETFKNYLQSVHYVDQAVGTFIKNLEDSGMWENSIFVLFGDHDSALMKLDNEVAKIAGVMNDPLAYAQLSDQVPLIIHLPDDVGAGVYNQVGGQIDLAPTILDLLGIKIDNNYMMGKSLFQEDRLVIFRRGSFTNDQVFYQATNDGVFENGTCYDLETNSETSVDNCRSGYDETIRRLNISDLVLSEDLIKTFLNIN